MNDNVRKTSRQPFYPKKPDQPKHDDSNSANVDNDVQDDTKVDSQDDSQIVQGDNIGALMDAVIWPDDHIDLDADIGKIQAANNHNQGNDAHNNNDNSDDIPDDSDNDSDDSGDNHDDTNDNQDDQQDDDDSQDQDQTIDDNAADPADKSSDFLVDLPTDDKTDDSVKLEDNTPQYHDDDDSVTDNDDDDADATTTPDDDDQDSSSTHNENVSSDEINLEVLRNILIGNNGDDTTTEIELFNPFRELGFYKDVKREHFNQEPSSKPYYRSPHTGLIINESYCDHNDLFNLQNPSNLMDQMYFVTDYDRSNF